MREASLADLVPLWRTLREGGVTALVTPALDYVGALELSPLDASHASLEALAASGEALRSLVGGLDDACTLHFLYRVDLDGRAEVAAYEACHGCPEEPALAEYVAARARWLEGQPLRRVRLWLFFSAGGAGVLQRGALGSRLPFGSLRRLSAAAHEGRLARLATLRNSLSVRLGQVGLQARELEVEEVQALHLELLNPTHAARGWHWPRLEVHDTLWGEAAVAREGPHLREYTEAEQAVLEPLEEAQGYLRQEGTYRRALTLKLLPEGGTAPGQAEGLLRLATVGPSGAAAAFPYWLSTTVHVQPQGRARFLLNAQHGLVEALRTAVPILADTSVARQAADAAKQQGIAAAFAELAELSSKLVTLSVTVLVDGASLEELEARTDAARAAFSAAGNSQLLLEEVSQLPAFLSVLPGAGPYALRRKACTSRNAADFLPVFAPWRGCARAVSLLATPLGDAFRFDPFDRHLSPAHHGLVVADTGSGKSVTLGALTLDALATGIDAILVDAGGSWEPMTHLVGGVHLPVDLTTPLTPFRPWEEVVRPDGTLDPEAIQDVVTFLELCVREEGQSGFDRLTVQLVARAVAQAYEGRLRQSPSERPLMSHFRDALGALGQAAHHPDDRRICEDVHRRLGLFVGDALYGAFLDRPSALRFDARLLTFDLAAVSKSPITRSVAMATVMSTITARAAARRRRTLVEVDEGHAYLGQDATSERFLERCYRQMRKHDVAMWMISQQFSDFVKAKSGDAILGNSPLKLFLRHRSGHDAVADYFHFSQRTRAAFRGLDMQAGHFSDILLLYGERVATVRLALHPLAYWVLTTDASDKRLIALASARNPHLSRLDVLQHLARRWPHGAPKGQGALPG